MWIVCVFICVCVCVVGVVGRGWRDVCGGGVWKREAIVVCKEGCDFFFAFLLWGVFFPGHDGV